MGDIGTHAQITHFVGEQMRRVLPTTTIPEADYSYVELGNFLTDVSQFRDPPAFHRAREEARAAAIAAEPIMGSSWAFGRDSWANGMFGRATPATARHGWLAEFMRLICCGVTHQFFDPDGILRAVAAGAAMGLPTPAVTPHPIPVTEVDRVFTAHYTQYWPHEHLDFPPVRDLHRHWGRPGFTIGHRNILAYLERYLQYLSEELSKLEFEWATATIAGTLSDRQRRDFLVRLGHLLHAVEDYYFHSNFVEVRQWRHAEARHPEHDTSTIGGHDAIALVGLVDTSPTPTSIKLRRLLNRRLQYPIYDRGEVLSRSASRSATDFVYTGGFGQSDVWHTLGGALEAIEGHLRTLSTATAAAPPGTPGAGGLAGGLAALRTTDLILLRLLFNEGARQDMVDHNRKDAHMATHATQLTSGRYDREITALQATGHISARAAECFLEAFVVDRTREAEYSQFPGPGGVLINMLDLMQRERTASATRVRTLDTRETSITDRAGDNRASGENIGTHSLMSKDASDKHPLREDALALAKHASAGITVALANRIRSSAPISHGIDWDTVLRFFVRFPHYRSRRWEEEIIMGVRRGSFSQPDVTALADQPRFRMLAPDFHPGKLNARRTGTTMRELENQYQSFESNP